MSATDILLEDHRQIRRLGRIIQACHTQMSRGQDIPIQDMYTITRIIDGFLDAIHYSREEDAYFACVASYGTLDAQIRNLTIEHEFSRRISGGITRGLQGGGREQVVRYMRTYCIYLEDHMRKEEEFLKEARSLLDVREERHMYERFAMDAAVKLHGFLDDMERLEGRGWCNV